jgi:hypothetical protein
MHYRHLYYFDFDYSCNRIGVGPGNENRADSGLVLESFFRLQNFGLKSEQKLA